MQEKADAERSFGPRIGRFFQGLLESHGITVHGEDELERFAGEGRVRQVITRGGLELDADAVVVGAGVSPDVALAQKAGLEIGERGGVRCSSRLESSHAGVFAAGTSANTTPSCTAARCGSSTGTSPSTTARPPP